MLYRYIQDGGPLLMWPIAVLSVVATLLVLERSFWWARYALRREPALRRDVLDARITSDAALVRSRDPVAEAAHWFRADPVRGRLMADRLVAESRRSIVLLQTIAALSTSLGLFGTVVGVSMSLDSMSVGKSDDVAHGLAVALYTTVAGLFNYLTCFLAATACRHFSEGLEEEVATVERIVRTHQARIHAPAAAPPAQPGLLAGGRA